MALLQRPLFQGVKCLIRASEAFGAEKAENTRQAPTYFSSNHLGTHPPQHREPPLMVAGGEQGRDGESTTEAGEVPWVGARGRLEQLHPGALCRAWGDLHEEQSCNPCCSPCCTRSTAVCLHSCAWLHSMLATENLGLICEKFPVLARQTLPG